MAATDQEARLQRLELENQRLRRAVEELSILNEVALAVSSTSSLNEIVELIVQKSVKHLRVEQGAVLLIDAQQEASAPMRTMVRKVQSDVVGIPYRLGDQITGWMLKNQQPLTIQDLDADSRFRLPQGGAGTVRSLLCVPLRLKGRMIGVLSVFNKRGSEFTEADQRLLTIIAAQSAQVIENARLYEEEKALAHIERELTTAREIQQNLLPQTAPETPGYDIAGRSEAARRVGGDYFDFLAAGDGSLGICLADVSGKGISASLLMANVQATIRSQTRLGSTVAERLERSNELLYASTESDKFVTMFYGILDPKTHQLRYANAGHNPPLLMRASGDEHSLTVGGPVLGVLPTFRFEEATVEFQPGDTLLIYSDGFSEAMNLQLEEFGEERLHDLAAKELGLDASGLIDRLTAEVLEFCGKAPQTDDMSMVVVKRTA